MRQGIRCLNHDARASDETLYMTAMIILPKAMAVLAGKALGVERCVDDGGARALVTSDVTSTGSGKGLRLTCLLLPGSLQL